VETIGGVPIPAQPTAAEAEPPPVATSPAPVETTGGAPEPLERPAPPETEAPAQPVPAADRPATTVETEAKPRRRSGGLILVAGILAVIVLAVAGYQYLISRDSPSRANVGDCLSGTENPAEVGNIKLIDCGDANATFRVTQKVADQPKTGNDTVCSGVAHDDVFWYGGRALWFVGSSDKGTILCLVKLKS
jgi:hypothetical protein